MSCLLVAAPKEVSVSCERSYLNEDAALQKLLLPLKDHETIQVPDDIPLKVPNNNPFKKRKLDEKQLDQIKSNPKEVLVVTDIEKLDVLCITPDIILPKAPENNNSGKRKLHSNQLDQRQSISKEVSVITEVEDTNLHVTTESQESVNSKPKKVSKGKARSKTEKKKTNNCMSSVNKSTSILNFFPRV